MLQSQTPDTTRLYLVRHGATDANLQRPHVLQGKGIDLSLNELGRQQAAAVGRFLAAFPIQHVYASPMRRAMQTAQAIAEHHAQDVVDVPEIVEADVGNWEGLDWGRIMREHPDEYRAFIDDPGRNPYLGGESYGDVQRRVQPALQGLLQRHPGETIAVVAHNVVNRVYLAGLMNVDLKYAKGLRQSNAGVNVVRHRRGETEVITLNAHFHLEGVEAT
ncbi:MAG: histidine phosphatase family protein [Planctomycetaceae bacterium]